MIILKKITVKMLKKVQKILEEMGKNFSYTVATIQ